MNRLRSGIWNSTIKIPELKRPLPIVPSITAQDEAVDMMTDFMTKHKGGLLVVTGAGNVYHWFISYPFYYHPIPKDPFTLDCVTFPLINHSY
jgi:hypothetical protein